MSEYVQPSDIGEVINVQEAVEQGKGERLLSLLSAYPKYKSFGALASSGLPVPRAMVITSPGASAETECNKILSEWGVEETVVRTDRRGGGVYGVSSQGCKIEDVWKTASDFLDNGLLPMVISTGDIFHNTYSANIVVDPKQPETVDLEVVGPGFCATDINKRDIVNERGTLVGGEGRVNLRHSQIVDQKNYEGQIELLKETLIKKEEKRRGAAFSSTKEAQQWVNEFLTEKDALILKHSGYTPIPSKYIQKVWSYIPQMVDAGQRLGLKDKPFIVSMSFVQEEDGENPYFWDIHPFSGYEKPEKQNLKKGVEGLKDRYFRREGD